ncbi:acyl-CoA thioesterase II [Cutibacterium sp. WCA-380-WT-3A]|uniref:Acyl-CoA thioesterase II n=1 Tax=Cutibacterium porci TaxID=2605781 RepID=A0A7K0J6N3_9ACTN|nr:acyl-CoA thioesterase domain-containing protein [Cutibacterium porci]MSS45620.1 acyl-CoA thioesterase II [Cutibacterium porci]
MPSTTAELLDLLDLEDLDLDLFRGRQPHTTWQRTFGGQVLAQALVASARTTPERTAHSMHALFLHAGRTDLPMIFDVERIRDGRTFSTRRVNARQYGRTIFTAEVSFKNREDGPEHSDPMPDYLPGPENCPTLAQALEQMLGRPTPTVKEWDALDVRLASSGPQRPDPNHATHLSLWVRTTASLPDDRVVQRAILAYISDISLMAGAVMPHLGSVPPGMVVNPASLDHAMWFHRTAEADRWMLYDQVSPSASGLLGFSMGRLMQDGKLIASCCQEGVMRLVDAKDLDASVTFPLGRSE